MSKIIDFARLQVGKPYVFGKSAAYEMRASLVVAALCSAGKDEG